MKRPDVICLSHLRWNFVFQRPNHLMCRCARDSRVHFVEEPETSDETALRVTESHGLRVLTPQVNREVMRESTFDMAWAQRTLLDRYLRDERISEFVLWFYTPMALCFARHLAPELTVYDCMDELSAFAGAPPSLVALEEELFERADIVFTGGQSLYEAKRSRHGNVHAFPSSVDTPHFLCARDRGRDPSDQATLRRPRVGYFGVIDERLDLALVDAIARARPDIEFVLIGPVAKIDPTALPRVSNVHHLGQKSYGELPSYIAGWDVAMMPFAHNDATRFISPTKTLEYMAAGKPIVSTSIRDVVRPYGEEGLVRIADGPDSFLREIDAAIGEERAPRLRAFDAFLRNTSWDATWGRMAAAIEASMLGTRQRSTATGEQALGSPFPRAHGARH